VEAVEKKEEICALKLTQSCQKQWRGLKIPAKL